MYVSYIVWDKRVEYFISFPKLGNVILIILEHPLNDMNKLKRILKFYML